MRSLNYLHKTKTPSRCNGEHHNWEGILYNADKDKENLHFEFLHLSHLNSDSETWNDNLRGSQALSYLDETVPKSIQ